MVFDKEKPMGIIGFENRGKDEGAKVAVDKGKENIAIFAWARRTSIQRLEILKAMGFGENTHPIYRPAGRQGNVINNDFKSIHPLIQTGLYAALDETQRMFSKEKFKQSGLYFSAEKGAWLKRGE